MVRENDPTWPPAGVLEGRESYRFQGTGLTYPYPKLLNNFKRIVTMHTIHHDVDRTSQGDPNRLPCANRLLCGVFQHGIIHVSIPPGA